jgi:preprotein translocase subunit SecD
MKLTWKIWLMLVFLLLSAIWIFNIPPLFLEQGVIVKSLDTNSTIHEAGLSIGDVIIAVNDQKVKNFEEYSNIMVSFSDNPQEQKIVLKTQDKTIVFFSNQIPEIVVQDISSTNIQTGLDLRGGARALVRPEVSLTNSQMQELIATTSNRLNIYGLQDVQIRQVSDLSGNNFMLVEIAGATPSDLESLISEQGHFEAKIKNETVFTGGNEDIKYVCRNDAQCARIESCQTISSGEVCSYSFEIRLSEAAAKKHAEITRNLGRNESNPGYLDETIDFYVDNTLTTSLSISENLKGVETTQVQIQGSATGQDRQTAYENAQDEMKKMQTILITGSLPYDLTIEKLDTISPAVGKEFNKIILYLSIGSFLVVALIIFFRYKSFKHSLALLFTSFSEIFIILGIAALINWNLDLPAIIGILVTIGTGVDQQIVILDESNSKRSESLKQKIRSALFIIFSAYITTIVALIPLMWAGAGLLKGFAVTTLIGLTIGVLITRPAFADIVKLLDSKNAP